MRKLSVLIISIVLLLMSACTPFIFDTLTDLDFGSFSTISKLKEKISKETILVERIYYKERPEEELGFFVYMNADEAKKMGAPSGMEFIKLFDERVTQAEQVIGHKICQHGFNISSRQPVIHERDKMAGVWTLMVDCNP